MADKTKRYKLVETLSPGDVVNGDNGKATILSCERARWIEVSGGPAFEIKYRMRGEKFSCIQSGKDRLEVGDNNGH